MSSTVKTFRQSAYNNSTCFCKTTANVFCRPQSIFCRFTSSNDPHRSRSIEPPCITCTIKNQWQVRNPQKFLWVIHAFAGQNTHTQSIAPHHTFMVIFRVQILCAYGRSRTDQSFEFLCFSCIPRILCIPIFFQHALCRKVGRPQNMRQPQPAQKRVRPAHRLSSRKCHSRMLPAMPAFRLSTRSVIGMRTVPSQAAMVASVRPWPSLPMTTQTPPG